MYFVGLASSALPDFRIGAYGSNKIFEETTLLAISKYDRYGSYWYHLKGTCFGFSEAPITEISSLDPRAQGLVNRLSWRLNAVSLRNETVCRMLEYESEQYRKVIYVRKKMNSFRIPDGN